jgi:alanine dehydrogenase
LVIGAVLIPGAATPKLVTRENLTLMRKGTVIVDVAVDQGGCFESIRRTYHDAPTYVEEGIIHYGVANMPGAVSRTSTFALNNATLGPGLKIAALGLEAAIIKDKYLFPGVNCYAGYLTCNEVAEAFGMDYTPLDAVMEK